MGFQDLFYMAIFIGVLVTVHEAGHFFAAKWANVKVLKFSIGFGPKLFGFRRGETEYQIAALPLGGFVQMAGQYAEDQPTDEDLSRTYLGAPWWKRVIISIAGPVANLVFPLVALFFVFLGDEQAFAARVGSVEPESPAAVAGLRSGDLIVDIGGTPIRSFKDISAIAQSSAGKQLDVTIEREGQRQSLKVTPAGVDTLGLLEIEKLGRIGVSAQPTPAVLGVPLESIAAKAGLQTFDRVASVNGKGVHSLDEVEAALDAATGDVTLQVLRFKQLSEALAPELVNATLTPGEGKGLARIGADRGDVYAWEVRTNMNNDPSRGTAAKNLGIKVGDRFVSVAGAPVHSLADLEGRMALARKKSVDIEWSSNGELHSATVGPLAPEGNAKYCMAPTDFGVRFGAPSVPQSWATNAVVTLHMGPLDAMKASLRKLPEGVVLIGRVLSKIPTGEVPLESMGGPVQMAQIASQSAEQGLDAFLSAMAMVSVNLALVNLLPIPILDGFNILIALWEAIRRRPPSMRVREVTTYLGFAVLAVLMVVAWRNDIARILFC